MCDGFFGRQRTVIELLTQRLAFQILHDQEVSAVFLADIIDADHVWVGQPGVGAGFAAQAGDHLVALCRRQMRRDAHGLDRHAAPDPLVPAFVDDGHPAAPGFPYDGIIPKMLPIFRRHFGHFHTFHNREDTQETAV